MRKWRLERKESTWHKLNKPRTFRKFNRVEKAAILFTVIFLGTFLPVVADFEFNSGYPGTWGYHARDPFTTIWNGQTPQLSGQNSKTPGTPQFIQSLSTGAGSPCSTSCTVNIVPKYAGDLILVTIFGGFNPVQGFSFTVTDAATDTYTFVNTDQNNDFNHIAVTDWYTFSGFGLWNTPGSNLAVLITRVNGNTWGAVVTEWSGVSAVAATGQCNATNNFPTQALNCNYLDQNSPYAQPFVEIATNVMIFNVACPTPATTVNGTAFSLIATNGCGSTPFQFGTVVASPVLAAQPSASVVYNITLTNSGPQVQYNLAQTTIQEGVQGLSLLSNQVNQCNPGYKCFFANSGVNGTIQLYPTTAHDSVMLTNTTIDMSQAVSKQLAIYETWLTQEGSAVVGKSFGFYLTINATLPQNPAYSPLTDGSVGMAVVVYFEGAHVWHANLYMQKAPNEPLLADSGLGRDPTNCTTSATLYLCATGTVDLTGFPSIFQMLSPVLNFTGGATPGGVGGQQSYLCFPTTGTSFCQIGGSGNSVIAIQAKNTTSFVLPWLRLQGIGYHLGLWAEQGLGTTTIVRWGNQQPCGSISPCVRNLDQQANVFSIFVPNPATLNPNIDTGGWFGALSKFFIQNTCAGLKVLTFGLADPCTAISQAGQDLSTSFISGFLFVFSALFNAFRFVLNTFGNLVGLGNLGDLIISLLAVAALLITTGLTSVVNFFVAIGNFLTSGWLAFLAGTALIVPTLITLGLVIWNAVFNANFNVKTLLYADGLLLCYATYKKGLAGFGAWVALNVFIFTFVFNIAWTIFDIITRPIHRTKTTVDPVG